MKTLSIKCSYCGNEGLKLTQYVNENKKLKQKSYCTRACFDKSKVTSLDLRCVECTTPIKIVPSVYKKSNTKRFFCSKSCSATFNNKNKQHGTRRSKLEKYIEKRLLEDFPTIEWKFNDRTSFGVELDVLCPSLKLGIEINGIVHYEPIYGKDVLERTQERDKQKMIRCYEAGIELIVVNAASHSYVNEKTCEKYYSTIKEIIANRTPQRIL